MTQHLPVLPILVPLLAGLLASLAGRRAWLVAMLATALTFAACLGLAGQVLASDAGVVSYALGGWGQGDAGLWIGIELRIDRLNAFVLCVIAGMAAIVTPAAGPSVSQEVPADRRHHFYAVYLLCVAGMLGITATGDAFNLYVLLEISSLTAYALVAMGKGRDRRALTGSFKYLVFGTVGASFLLLGIGYLIAATGTLNMGEMGERLVGLEDSRTVRTAFALIMVGLSLKMALFPLHHWLPDAYTYAPSAVTTLLASTATKVAVYVSIRFVYTIFGPAFCYGLMGADTILITCSCLAIIGGSLQAIRQTDLKRLLAYSSVAQIGYLALGVALNNTYGLAGGLIHVLNHALVKGGLFVAAACLIYRAGAAHLDDLSGLRKTMPGTAALLILGGLGLIGVPLTGGFVSKWMLVAGTLERGLWPVAFVVLVGSLLAVVYVMRFLEPVLFGPPNRDDDTIREAPPVMLIPGFILIGLALVIGMRGGAAGEVAYAAAQALLGGAP